MIYKKFKDQVFLFLGFLFSKRKSIRRLKKGFHKILIIQLQRLGDSIIFTPALRAIRKRYPDAKIDLLVNSISYSLYSKSPYIDKFWILNENKIISWKMLRLLRKIRKENYECSVLCVTQLAFRYNLISYLTGARERVGFNWKGRGFLNTITVLFDGSKFYTDLNLDIACALDAEPQGRQMELWHDDEDKRYVDDLLTSCKITKDKILVCIHPGSNWQSKMWFPERFAEIADYLISEYNAQVVFSGTERDRPEVDEIGKKMKFASVSLVGMTDIRQLAALIERCDLFLGVDSGPRHIASSVGTPSVLLISLSAIEAFHKWRPLDDNQIVLSHPSSCSPCLKPFCDTKECMKSITAEEVVKVLKQQIYRIKALRVALNEKGNEKLEYQIEDGAKVKVKDWWNSHPMDYSVTFPRETKEFFNEIDRKFLKSHYFGQDSSPVLSKLIDYRKLCGKKVLEIGCGLGTMCREFASHGNKVTAIDLTDSAVELTKKRLEIFGLKGNVLKGDAENLPFGDNNFDYVFSWGVLHHTPDTKKAIDEVYRILKPGGEIGVMLYHRGSLKYYVWILLARGILGFKLLTMSTQQLINRYTDGIRYRGNPHTIFVTRRGVAILFEKFKNVKFKIYGNKSEIIPRIKNPEVIPNSFADFILTKLGLGLFLWIQAAK